MPDNAIYYKVAYSVLVLLFVGYGLTIRLRRQAIAKRRDVAGRAS